MFDLGIAAGLVGTIGSAIMGRNAQKKAANIEANAIQQGNDLQWRMFEQNRRDIAPYREAGTNALQLYNDILLGKKDYSPFYQSPDYAFAQQEGQKAIDRAAAARGQYFSPSTMTALAEYNQNLARSGYGEYMNRLAGVSGIGQTATNSLAGLRTNLAGNIAQGLGSIGQARASGSMATSNAMNQTLNNLSGLYGMYQNQQVMSQPNPNQIQWYGPRVYPQGSLGS